MSLSILRQKDAPKTGSSSELRLVSAAGVGLGGRPSNGVGMPAAVRRSRSDVAAAGVRRAPKPVEYNILLTATLCLLAAGAVMVYSASSARTLLEGQGDGT